MTIIESRTLENVLGEVERPNGKHNELEMLAHYCKAKVLMELKMYRNM